MSVLAILGFEGQLYNIIILYAPFNVPFSHYKKEVHYKYLNINEEKKSLDVFVIILRKK